MCITKIQKYKSKHKFAAYSQIKTLETGESLQFSLEEARSPTRLGSTSKVFSETSTTVRVIAAIIPLSKGEFVGAFTA